MTFVGPTFTGAVLALWQETAPPDIAPFDGGAALSVLLQTILWLGVVCALIYVGFRWLLPRLAVARSTHRMVRVVDAVALEPRKNLYVIEVAGRWMLVAASDAGVQLIGELDAAAAEEAAAAAPARASAKKAPGMLAGASFADRLARIMNKKR
jgi:flagellar protein FliO/FliZ